MSVRPHGAEYRTKARSIAFNLRGNAGLRARVLDDTLSAAELCTLSPNDLATDGEALHSSASHLNPSRSCH
jgi:hypothetical protein